MLPFECCSRPQNALRLARMPLRSPAPARFRRRGKVEGLRGGDPLPCSVHARRFQRAPALREREPQARRGRRGAGALERAARLRLLSRVLEGRKLKHKLDN